MRMGSLATGVLLSVEERGEGGAVLETAGVWWCWRGRCLSHCLYLYITRLTK